MQADARNIATLGLLIRSVPYQQRSAREQHLDVALAAAALEIPLRLYFQGGSILQLVDERDTALACLPAGYRGWGSLTGLTQVVAFAEPDWLNTLAGKGLRTVLVLVPMTVKDMRADFAACDRVLTP